MKRLFTGALLGLIALPGLAAIQTETVEYEIADTTHQGYLAYDDEAEGDRPGVLVIPEWWGLNDYARMRARQLAEAGYVAFAADMYGQGKTTEDPAEAGEWSKAAKTDLRGLGEAALRQLAQADGVDAERLAAIGFCFGGTSVLELSYTDAPVDAVVSLHGNLPTPASSDTIDASVLVLHGAADPMVPMADVTAFAEAMESRPDTDWHLTMFGHAEHAFTNPEADSYGIDGVSYNETAAERAWRHTKMFLAGQLDHAGQ